MQKDKRTDRILILLTLLLLLGASGLFYFDSWMWGKHRGRDEKIGFVSERIGDVRVKYEGDLKWQRAPRGQDLVYDDSIYSGSSSTAHLQLGASEMTVTENSLVVLRREDAVNFMGLRYGNLFGKIAANEKLVIDSGDGKRIEISAKKDTHLVVRKDKGHTTFDIVSGDATVSVGGQTTVVNKATRLTLAANEAPQFENVALDIVRPLSSQTYYSEDPTQIDFEWRWLGAHKTLPSDQFQVEFGTDPLLSNVYARREARGRMQMAIKANEDVTYYFRVKGPRNAVSVAEQLNFVRMRQPVITRPEPGERFLTPEGTNGLVDLAFRKPKGAEVVFEIATDSEFKNVFATDRSANQGTVKELPVGQYFLRAKSDYGLGHQTTWTQAIPFAVDYNMEILPLSHLDHPNKVLIANRNYPEALYSAEPKQVASYLAQKGFLRQFFQGDFDRLDLDFYDETSLSASREHRAWPQAKLQPSSYKYRYQAFKSGFLPSLWSTEKSFEIAMEPPRPKGKAVFASVDKAGEADVSWKFTPLLFARSYDVEVADNPLMRNAQELRVASPEVKTKAAADQYWRARARDSKGRIISDYSRVYKNEWPVPVFLAQNPLERKPAAEESTSSAKVERLEDQPFHGNGWWAWFGMGESYVDYRESIPTVGTANSHKPNGPTEYVETGFVSNNSGWGGIFSFKRIPGQMVIDNAPLDRTDYTWTTAGLEGVLRKSAPFSLFGDPVVYGLRAGVQEHHIPFIFFDGFSNVYLKNTTMTDLSAGVQAEWFHKRWTYYWLMRYQLPVLSSADGSAQFGVTPVFAFDGSLGAAYNLTRQLKAGLFWYGQWHQFNYSYGDGQIVDTGFQSLFYSNVDFRLGWEF